MRDFKKAIVVLACILALIVALTGCSSSIAGEKQVDTKAKQVVIYTNADKEATEAIERTLNDAGYTGKYVLKTMGTSELGGKLMAEGNKIEANLITMSSYFIESAQEKNNMFCNMPFTVNALGKTPAYYAPVLANTSVLFVNTQILKEKNLAMPTSIKDLTADQYKDLVAIPNIMHSSTAWLMIQAVISQYGEAEGQEILQKLIANCGPHIEASGSGPIKKVRAGEVAAGFGIRHQAVMDKNSGKPMDYVDPSEGNFSLVEAVAIVDKEQSDPATTKFAGEMAKVIVEKARAELIKYYPVELYQGEAVDTINKPTNSKTFAQPLTVELLAEHQKFFKAAQN